MQKCVLSTLFLLSTLTLAFAGVAVNSPAGGATVQSPVHYIASATSSCAKGVASMGIYTAPNVLAYTSNGASLNTSLNLSPGTYSTVVEEWDYCGGAATVPVTIKVSNQSQSQVQVTTPANNSQVGSPVNFVATSSSSCPQGVAAMGIYSAPNQLAYKVSGANLNTNLSLTAGTYNTVVEEWDNCGGAATTPITVTVSNASKVQVSSPANNSTVNSPVPFTATSTSSCPKGVAAMGIYSGPNQLAYQVSGSKLNTTLSLGPGTYHATVEEWDYCGGAATTPVTFTVSSGGNVISNVQGGGGWTGYIELPPDYGICSTCSPSGPQTTWWTKQGVSSPSMSGDAMEFDIGGSTDYSDVLWNVHLLGDGSPILDQSHQIVPNTHNFIYDVWFYGTNVNLAQSLEFDINQFVDGFSFIWGHQCTVMGGHEWQIWNNQANAWVSTGVSCYPNSNAWNHLTIQVQRTSDNQLLYQTITFNGQQSNLNATYPPTSSSWYGVTINYQMDGNYAQQNYAIYLDDLNFTYW